MKSRVREEAGERIERDMAVSYPSRFAVLQGLASRPGTARPDTAPRARVFVMDAPDLDAHSGALFNGKARPILPSADLDKERVGRFMAASDDLLRRALA
ncbi:hypothetical protein [Streptomyces sp. NPDC008092]|uniref:hypothetical protein n=1 Tax=Streptomyces sp. NPDC008092 TaxID=3364808 RepID=UPI0036E8417F